MATTNTKYNQRYKYAQLSASTNAIKTGYGLLGGIFVSSATTLTITIYDNTTGTGTKIVDTFTAAAATRYAFDTVFDTGLSIVITGTGSFTLMYQ